MNLTDADGVTYLQVSAGGCWSQTGSVIMKIWNTPDPDSAIQDRRYGSLASMDNSGPGGAICDRAVGIADLRKQAISHRGGALLVVVQFAEIRSSDQAASIEGVDRPWLEAFHLRRLMGSPVVLAPDVASQGPHQMPLIEDECVFEAVSPSRTDRPPDVGFRRGDRALMGPSPNPVP